MGLGVLLQSVGSEQHMLPGPGAANITVILRQVLPLTMNRQDMRWRRVKVLCQVESLLHRQWVSVILAPDLSNLSCSLDLGG